MPPGAAHEHSVVQEKLPTLRFVISSRNHRHSSLLRPPGTSGWRDFGGKRSHALVAVSEPQTHTP